MDWISGIQQAINYTEEHLCEETDYDAIARQAASSSFHFQRVFSMICGFTLGDYIRMRRCQQSRLLLRDHDCCKRKEIRIFKDNRSGLTLGRLSYYKFQ